MRTMTIRIERDERTAHARMKAGFVRASKSGKYQGEHRSFESPAALFRVLTPTRWILIERLQALGPSTLRGLARELERDVKAVHRDVAALRTEGFIERDAEGKLLVPFARIHAEFDLAGEQVAA